MKNFLNMIGNINKMLMVHIEGAIYRAGDEHIEGYQGAIWKSKKVGDRWITYPDIEGKVRLHSAANYCDVRTDAKSAGAAITVLIVNRLVWQLAEQGNDVLARQMSDLYHNLVTAVYECPELDHASICAFLD